MAYGTGESVVTEASCSRSGSAGGEDARALRPPPEPWTDSTSAFPPRGPWPLRVATTRRSSRRQTSRAARKGWTWLGDPVTKGFGPTHGGAPQDLLRRPAGGAAGRRAA